VASLSDSGRVKGGKVHYHSERAREAIRMVEDPPGCGICIDGAIGAMLVVLAYDHARCAATAALNGMGRRPSK